MIGYLGILISFLKINLFLLIFFKHLYWSIIALQWCVIQSNFKF